MTNRGLTAAVCLLLSSGVVAAASATDSLPLPRPGLWRETSTARHLDRSGRVIRIGGVEVRHTSNQFCMTPEQSRSFWVNPLPGCQAEFTSAGDGSVLAKVFCPASGLRVTATNRVTPTSIDLQKTETGGNGVRVESVTHSDRLGDCPAR